MKEEKTAIIVNDKGEVFTHWAMRVSFTASGAEDFYMVPQFYKTYTVVFDENNFWPMSMANSRRKHYTVNKPYVFSSVRTAERALKRMRGYYRAAIVT